jgi:transposase InsO family protein
MCDVLDVSPSGYYGWIERAESPRYRRHQQLVAKIKAIHRKSREIYGSPRVHGELIDNGIVVGKNTVAKLMQRHRIQSKVHKRFVITTDSRHGLRPAENVLNRDFDAHRPNQKWVSDVTFIPTREGWLYLATVMDLFSRKIIGWSMGNSNNTALISQALLMAIAQRTNVSGVILHSDRGIQYASRDYQKIMREHGIICSMSRRGNCWDNAVMESFYHSLKTECVVFEDYRTRSQARSSLFDYIELFYNRQRRHSSLAYKSPATYESIMGVH